MSLEKQVVTVPLIDGITEQDDAFAHDPPGFISLTEVRWNRDKQICKRYGFTDRTDKGSSAPAGVGVAGLHEPNTIIDLDGVPHVMTSDGTVRRDVQAAAWSRMTYASPRPSRVTTDPVVRSRGSAVKSDVAYINGIACVVWEGIVSGGVADGVRCQFFDITQDVPRPLCPPQPIGGIKAINFAPRIVALGGRYFVVAGLDAASGARTLYAAAYDSHAGDYTFGTSTTVDTISAPGGNFYALDADDSRTTAYIAYRTGASNRSIAQLDMTATVLATATLVTGADPQQLVHNTTSGHVVVIDNNGAIDHIAANLSGVATQITPFTAPPSGAYSSKFVRAAIGMWSSGGVMVAMRSTSAPAAFAEPCATQIILLTSGYAKTTDNLVGGVTLATLCSRLVDRTARPYVGLTGAQAWYTADDDPTVSGNLLAYRTAPVALICQVVTDPYGSNPISFATVARVGQDAVDLLANSAVASVGISSAAAHLPHLAWAPEVSLAKLITAYPIRTADMLGGAIGAFKRGVDLAQIGIQKLTPSRNVNAQSLRVIGCGHGASTIDGALHSEMTPAPIEWLDFDGFDSTITQPAGLPHLDTTGSPWGGGPNPNRQWGFRLLWRYTDQHGNIHRGPPSSTLWSLAADLVDAGFHPGRIVFWPWSAQALAPGELGVMAELEVYACPFDGNNDFRLLGIVKPAPDTTVDGRLFIAVTSNVAQTYYSVELQTWDNATPVPRSLYTTATGGDELEAVPTPAFLSLCSTQARLWGLNAEDRLDVWYTKPIALGYAPEFNDTLRVRVPQDGGPGVAIAAMDDKVVVFKQSKIFVIEGEGGDAAGNGSSLRTPRLVSSDVGCVSVESVVEGPFGIVFMSQRGFMLLGRDLTYNFVGDRVIDQLKTDSDFGAVRVVRSSAIVPSEAEVRFVIDDPTNIDGALSVIVWNYRFNRWCRRDVGAPTTGATVGDVEWWLYRDPNTGIAADVSQETPLVWTLSNYGVSGETSWIKLDGIAGYGRVWRAVFVLRWYSGGIQIQTAQDYSAPTESDRTWDSSEMFTLAGGGTARLVELAVNPLVQKCEAIQFRIFELGTLTEPPLTTFNGRGFELVGVTLEAGVKKGAFKRIDVRASK